VTITRTLCPLCDWHHDQADFDPNTPQPFAGEVAPDDFGSLVRGYSLGRALVVENALRAHLETHELIEWVQALATVKDERDLYRQEVDASHEERRKLQEMLGREYEATQRAEATIERVRAIHNRAECGNVRCEHGGWCIGCDPNADSSCSENPWPCPTIRALEGEQDGADSYAAMVNAPLRPETIKALRERLASGDYPRRKVRLRDVPPARGMTDAEAAVILPKVATEGIDTEGCDCGHQGMGVSWHRDYCEWRSNR
jgi:hypothetical protein